MHTDPHTFGFSPDADGLTNTKALQQAADQAGTISVTRPGTYRMAGTIYLSSDTTLQFGRGVFLKKTTEAGPFTHVLLNKGALTRTYDERITVDGLHLIVNGVDQSMDEVYGLRGQIAFFYAKDVRITGFRCLDLAANQFAVHACTFEDLVVQDAIIRGKKDGVHLGRGTRFTIRDCVFETFDDAVALNAHDYASSNPELGWIEDGVVENCHDLPSEDGTTGFFCRILAGGWGDWTEGMEVQHSDSVVCEGRLYRVQMDPNGEVFTSTTRPTHTSGAQVLDGINWGVVQQDETRTAGVRNVTFRDIFLKKPRVSFSVHFDNDRFSRSYYPGAPAPVQQRLVFDGVRVLHDGDAQLLTIGTPMDVLTVSNTTIGKNTIRVHCNSPLDQHLTTHVNLIGCTFEHDGELALLRNEQPGRDIRLSTASSVVLREGFRPTVDAGPGTVTLQSDLPGLGG